ncbi:PhzF family phenazine biosynthesis protein [bacterium]|nr:PhzF family phenazine biosynthesis protein [bacterium]
MKIPLYQIDAFTGNLFKGNPAAVCPLNEWLNDETLLNIAAENNLSETAFFVKEGMGYRLRWFTPEVEVDLCGHATLAAAFVIFNYIDPSLNRVVFATQSGNLTVTTNGKLLAMDFPSRKPAACSPPHDLIKGLGVSPAETLKSRDYFVVYSSEEEIKNLKPDMSLLSKLDALGVIVTAKGNQVDFVSRFFAPGAGIPEDPVTGSAHSSLIPYWAEKLAKSKLHALQVSKRGGELFCELNGDRVMISGHAVKYLEGFFEL